MTVVMDKGKSSSVTTSGTEEKSKAALSKKKIPAKKRSGKVAKKSKKLVIDPNKRLCRISSVGQLLPHVGGPIFRRFGFLHSTIISRWPLVVGEKYAKLSVPESIRFPYGQTTGGTLTIAAEGGIVTLMQHITPAIIERVNRFFGYAAIGKVSFRQGRLHHRDKTPLVKALPKTEQLQNYLSEEDQEMIQHVRHPDLRESLIRLGGGIAKEMDEKQDKGSGQK
ncbi:MAG: DUF721 domain-containing protein [Zymomonas mobilis]|uniref:DUF721 domain-containing protein n=1 Tax=Zymomonas mobilis TaxID=542 RepID=A0A542W327_ZYMMB|nr:DUF721 domain-containing protein [Zymomonas mobilis]TQL17977.1 hypothetical protein FBY58_1591 [Zymomonas mobilis]